MTQDTIPPLDGGRGQTSQYRQHESETDLLAGLWEEAPFAQLPWDAPNEFKDFVENIENPKRVYAIHRAARRHGFQQLVEKFVFQLREGCGSNYCNTPTCFSCRKRSVGKVPIRRYNPTSARILAVYMASQDNAENYLCPALRSPKGSPAVVDSLLFIKKNGHNHSDGRTRQQPNKDHSGLARGSSLKGRPVAVKSRSQQWARPDEKTGQGKGEEEEEANRKAPPESPETPDSPKFEVSAKHTGKDYRSFAANMFGTIAFKMLEWLTPNALEQLHNTAREFQGDLAPKEKSDAVNSPQRKSSPRPSAAKIDSTQKPIKEIPDVNEFSIAEEEAFNTTSKNEHGDPEKSREKQAHSQSRLPTSTRPGTTRRKSNARVRTNSTAKPKRQLSIDTYPPESHPDESFAGLRSPRVAGLQADKTARSLKNPASALARPISQISNSGLFDEKSSEIMSPPKAVDLKSTPACGQVDGHQEDESMRPVKADTQKTPSEQSISETPWEEPESDVDMAYDNVLPQAVSKLNADMVDFMCDVLQEDGTAEKHLLEPATVSSKMHTRSESQGKSIRRRKAKGHRSYPPDLKREWRLFIEQSFFYVLSDPNTLIRSFTKKGQLYDSQTLWYCMLRLTRVTPTLVLHSLWLAAAQLFAPPKSVQSLRSPTARLFPKQNRSLSNSEAGILMSICLHALVAAAPVVSDRAQLLDISRIRSQGLSIAGSGAVARPPAELCLQYDDAFSNNLAMRLARRLLAAVTTRRYFDEMLEHESVFDEGDKSGSQPDILAPVFAQLDLSYTDAVSIFNFSINDRSLHETRVPILLLDWARAVMLHDWDGSPEVPSDGPFGGALALIHDIYKRRKNLLIGDKQFLSEYFAERLDDVEMPVAWLSFTSTKQKLHLLDFPYIFNPDTLVTYFRSINFWRMNHQYEESSSLKNRMERLFETGTLIINPHHKNVLQDMLRTASAKYLILDIGRKTIIRDAFDQLWRREERELLRPLKIHLGEDAGEEGLDSGGVQQEFFRMAMAEALDPKYGAFTTDDRTRMTWFQPGSVEAEWKFELVGLLMSLAVYNGLTLPVTFPMALYRKLLGEPVDQPHHIQDGWPELANGLSALLEWEEEKGLIEDVFTLTHEFSVSMFDTPVTRPMHPASASGPDEWPQFPKYPRPPSINGEEASSSARDSEPRLKAEEGEEDEAPLVTNETRNRYVSDYIRYLTDVSVRPQYEAFARGFRAVLHPKSLTLLSPSLLQRVVEGVQDIDIGELRRAARYVGWDASHRTVRDFWSIVKRYDDGMKRRLLEFVTASDRVPVGGAKNIQFIVQRNGDGSSDDGQSRRLPTAYTCFGTLLLPEYPDKEVLRERLAKALEHTQGFYFA